MRKMLHLYIWLYAVRCHQPKITLSAQEGGQVEIPCRYDAGYENYRKYFSKGFYGKTLIDTTGTQWNGLTQKGKYSISDDTKQRILRVTISNLSLNDGGTYWCGIDTYFTDPGTEIELMVCKAPLPPALSPLVVFRVVVVSAFLLLCLLAVMYFRLRKGTPITARTTSGCERDPLNACSMDAASSQIITEQEENTCNFSSPSTDAGDQHLLYSTVRFNAEAAAQPREQTRSAAGPSEVYATIRHTET